MQPGEDILASQNSGGSRIDWRRAIPRLLLVIIIVVLLVFGIAWIVRALTRDEPKPQKHKPATSQQDKQPAASDTENTAAERPQVADTSSESSSSSEASSEAASPQPEQSSPQGAGKPTAANAQLTNTGPGETIALFTVATATGITIYQVNLRRRFN